jgi:membrane protein involved in colicin uptake
LACVASRRAVRTRASAVATATTKASTIATTTSEARARAVATATTESAVKAAATVAASETTTAAKAAAATEATSASKSVLANLEQAPRPVVAVELLNGVLSILGSLESDDTRALGGTVGCRVNVSADDRTTLTEEVLQVLPANVVRELR